MSTQGKPNKWLYWVLLLASAVIIALLAMLTSNIAERKVESIARLTVTDQIDENEADNAVWGKHYPRQYETYRMTTDTSFKSKYAGSAETDYLEEFPNLVVMWAGYGFSKDYLQGRGHARAVEDIQLTLRTGGVENSPMPATCWSCKGPDVPRLMSKLGIKEFYSGKWIDKGHEVTNAIGCADCHDAKTMQLRISRPALVEAFARQGKDISKATHNEMRSLVCAQCHVEYYFKKPGNYLTFPWDNGATAEKMEAYYDDLGFKDWTHKLSKTPMLKTQHPDYELFSHGIHAKRGVSCADCHMPYKMEGGVKFTDHHVQSPLNNVENTCQVCHRTGKEELIRTVYESQDKIMSTRAIAEKGIATAHLLAEQGLKANFTEAEMKPVQTLIRHAQWRWDWIAAANSSGFHAPKEALRVLSTSIQKAEQAIGQMNTLFAKHQMEVPTLPDVSTKELAQKYIGIDIEAQKADKKLLLEKIAVEWKKQ